MSRAEKIEEAARALFVHELDALPVKGDSSRFVCEFCGANDSKDEDGRWSRRKQLEHGPGVICPWGRLREALALPPDEPDPDTTEVQWLLRIMQTRPLDQIRNIAMHYPDREPASVCGACQGEGIVEGSTDEGRTFRTYPCPDCTKPARDAEAERVEKAARWAAERAWDFAFMPTTAPKDRDAIIEAVVQDAIGVQYER